jgi:nucleoside 2-deoxyribosyltransferase
MKKLYIAGPFFNPTQIERVEKVKECLDNISGVDYFSPKDSNLWSPGDDEEEVFANNIEVIDECDAIVTITNDKDVGTMFESGYAYARGIPIIYLWVDRLRGQKFNLMLAASGVVCYTYNELSLSVSHLARFNRALDFRIDVELE